MKFLSLALALSLLACGSEGDESSSIPANNGSLALPLPVLTPRVYRAFLDDEASIGEDDCSFTVSNAEIPAYSQFTMAILIGDEIFTLLKETEEFKLFVVENEVSYRAVQGFKSGEVGLYLRCK